MLEAVLCLPVATSVAGRGSPSQGNPGETNPDMIPWRSASISEAVGVDKEYPENTIIDRALVQPLRVPGLRASAFLSFPDICEPSHSILSFTDLSLDASIALQCAL